MDPGEYNMGRLIGLMVFSLGLGLVIGLFIKSLIVTMILACLCLLLGYHLFCC